jgi:nucleoid DNA-binding protein
VNQKIKRLVTAQLFCRRFDWLASYCGNTDSFWSCHQAKHGLNIGQLSMTLTKRDLVVRISEETGLNQSQVFNVIQKTLDNITEALASGGKVEIRNFGVFEVKIRKARVGRNPNRPEIDVPIPNRAMVKFKAGKEMKAEVLKLTPKPAKKGAMNKPNA